MSAASKSDINSDLAAILVSKIQTFIHKPNETSYKYSHIAFYEMSKKLVSVAKMNKILYQHEIMGSRTGTNADSIAVSGHRNPDGDAIGSAMALYLGLKQRVTSNDETINKIDIKDRYDFYYPELAHIGEQAILNKEIFRGNGRWRIEHRIFSNKQDLTDLPTEHIVLFGKIRSRKYHEHIEELEFWEFDGESSIDTKAKRAKAIVK